MLANYNSMDLFILFIFSFSILIGLMRGLIREVLSLLAWVASFVVAILFSGRVATAFSGAVPTAAATSPTTSQSISFLSLGASFVGLFILTLFLGSMLSRFISQLVEGPGISIANRLLGALFGFVRGFLVILVMIFLLQLTPLAAQPGWKESQFIASFQPLLKWLDDLVQPGLSSLKAQMGSTIKNINPTQYIDKLKQNYQDTGASQFFGSRP